MVENLLCKSLISANDTKHKNGLVLNIIFIIAHKSRVILLGNYVRKKAGFRKVSELRN